MHSTKNLGNENVITSINQSRAKRGIYFWGEYKIILTNNILDIYQSGLLFEKRNKVPLQDIEFITQKRKFNGLSSFFYGLLIFVSILILAILIQIFIVGIHEGGGPHIIVFIFSGFYFWIYVFIKYFFRNQLIISTTNGKIVVNVYYTPNKLLNEFSDLVFKQKLLLKK